MKNVIVCLSKGYSSHHGYDELIKRNVLINEYIGNKYPLLVFNEGNIPPEHQEYIKNYTPSLDISFRDISAVWDTRYPYPSMCKFFAYDVWEYCKDYDNVLRIDTDCHIFKCLEDPFSLLKDYVFLKSVDWAEDHHPTNSTLPFFISKLVGLDPAEFYNHKFPYTNVYLSRVSFWREKEIHDKLQSICTSSLSKTNRWGDLPILGSLLNIYAKDKVGALTGLSYYHGSHQATIIC